MQRPNGQDYFSTLPSNKSSARRCTLISQAHTVCRQPSGQKFFSFFTAAQIFLFFDEEYKFGLAGILTFVCSIIVMLILRLAHNQLKNEIRIDTF